MSQQMAAGHLYIQTNEARNALIHYHRSANGALTEVQRVATDGGGSGTFKPISGQESSPNALSTGYPSDISLAAASSIDLPHW